VTLSFAVLRVTGSVGRLGLVLAVQATAALVLTLAGGLAADRFAPDRILIFSLAGRTAAAALLAGTLLAGTASFPLLLAAAAGYGCADGFFGPASTALVPNLVPRERLAPANALLGGSTSAAAIAAPALAGPVVAALGPGAGFVVQATLLAAAAGILGAGVTKVTQGTRAGRERAMRAGRERAAPAASVRRARVASGRGALRVGWGEFVRIRWLWLLTGQWLVFSMLTLAPVTVLALQASVRPDVLARVAAIDLVGSEGGQPVGYALAGPLAGAVGAHAFLTASAAIMAVAGTAFAFLPALRTERGDAVCRGA